MMRHLGMFCLGMCVVAWAATPVSAQRQQWRGGRGGGGFGGPGGLLSNASVQKELNLSEDQVTKIKEVVSQVSAKHKDEQAKLRELSREEQGPKRRELSQTMAKEAAKGLAGILKPEQEKRYKQISLQAQGARAFQDPEVQKQLKLTDDQKASLKTIIEDAAKEQQEIRQSAQGNRQEAGQKMAALRKETMEKAQNVLTDAQKTTWKDVTGKPFAIKFERPGGPRRGAA